MANPVIFISRNRIRPGKLAEFRQHYQASLSPTLESKPDTLAQLAYENEAGSEVTIVRLFPDAGALDTQIQSAEVRSQITYEMIEPTAIEIFGTPNSATLEKMLKIAGAGILVSIHPHYEGGFMRLIESTTGDNLIG